LLPHLSEEFRNKAKPFGKRAESMLVTSKRRIIMGNSTCSVCHYVSAILITLSCAVFCMSSDAYAGGVHFGFGIDVPPPGYAVAPPEVMYPPPVVVERTPPPPPVVVERRPPVVYEAPVVVERRSVYYYYYRPSYQYRSYHVETGREYYRHRSQEWEDDVEY
jgi:hypothetical protein